MCRRSSRSEKLLRGLVPAGGRFFTFCEVVAVLSVAGAARADEPQRGRPGADPSAPVLLDPATAHEDPPRDPGPPHAHEHAEQIDVVVRGEERPVAASALTVSGGELKLRPRGRAADVLAAVPGLIVVQHAGGGKANQYFLRGFDIDHGTDLALYVDGVPVNLPSHGHGQGYADLHFVIPELVATLEAYKGPYYVEHGDFATAGAVDMRLADHFHESQVSFTVGQYGVVRGLGIVSREVSDDWRFVLAGEVAAQDGPFESPENLRRVNVFGRVTHDLGPASRATLSWMSYASRWNGSGQIPARLVESGALDRFGSLNPAEGGAAQRHGASLRLDTRVAGADLELVTWLSRYDWRLYSDFTFFLADPVYGDMIEQTDDRTVFGLDARTRFHHHLGPLRLETRVGVQARGDLVDNGLFRDFGRERIGTTAEAEIDETALGLFVEEIARPTGWLTLRAGARLDRRDVSVRDLREDPARLGDGATGTAGATLVSPKASVALSPLDWLDFFVSFGRGFHSNDARGATRATEAADLLVPATGYEVGARARPWRPLTLSVAAYRLELESEQIYVGDAGTTEPGDASVRAGVELGARLYLGRYLFADAEAGFHRAELRPAGGGSLAVPLAPGRTVGGGVGLRAPFGLFGAVRVRHVGDRPASEDETLTAEGFTVLDARLGQRLGPFELAIDVQNLLDADWREAQFAGASRLRGETAPVDDIHFVPGWPIHVRATVSAYF
jgi:outer membrane receptor protein involved in Fe transport